MTPEEEARAIDYRETFATPHGARVLADIRREGYVTKALPTSHPIDPYALALHEGARRLAMLIESRLVQGHTIRERQEIQTKAVSSLTEEFS